MYIRAFLGHWPITEVDLHLDHVLEHVLFSHLPRLDAARLY